MLPTHHNPRERRDSTSSTPPSSPSLNPVVIGGDWDSEQWKKAAFWLLLWYFFSMSTLFLNKIILTSGRGDVHVLGAVQMISTAIYGGIKVYGPRLMKTRMFHAGDGGSEGNIGGMTFYQNMVVVGLMRGATVLLGLVSLSRVSVSFTETIKSSAPLFTCFIAYLMLGERTSWQVKASLIPVMVGLIVSTATEYSYDTLGFSAAVTNNVVDCFQNVFSKRLLVGGLTPVALQFYTSIAAATIQFPMLLYNLIVQMAGPSEDPDYQPPEPGTAAYHIYMLLFLDGISYHMQSVTAYCTMNLLSPITASVANTAKRAILILLSIWYFNNTVSQTNLLGVFVVVVGVFFYNYSRINYPPPEHEK